MRGIGKSHTTTAHHKNIFFYLLQMNPSLWLKSGSQHTPEPNGETNEPLGVNAQGIVPMLPELRTASAGVQGGTSFRYVPRHGSSTLVSVTISEVDLESLLERVNNRLEICKSAAKYVKVTNLANQMINEFYDIIDMIPIVLPIDGEQILVGSRTAVHYLECLILFSRCISASIDQFEKEYMTSDEKSVISFSSKCIFLAYQVMKLEHLILDISRRQSDVQQTCHALNILLRAVRNKLKRVLPWPFKLRYAVSNWNYESISTIINNAIDYISGSDTKSYFVDLVLAVMDMGKGFRLFPRNYNERLEFLHGSGEVFTWLENQWDYELDRSRKEHVLFDNERQQIFAHNGLREHQ